ncbi:putative translational elongation factor Ts [Candidatus Zinderia insecticola CARI]|uniref:Elongation factor Ts n=1 Tax=Zinderia insecticola (strain CARI) TaxID=871271 RepID=E0TIQ4_ZINIC|nr:putative translational elongation factor Ts [Candidatus Zinderia insecticola CARI]
MLKKNIKIIKKLRSKTQVSYIECKKILIKTKWNFKKSKKMLKLLLGKKINKITFNKTKNFITFSYINNLFNISVLIKIKCQNIIIIENYFFLKYVKFISKIISENKIYNLNILNKYKIYKKYIKNINYKIIKYFNENIIIKYFIFLKTINKFINYNHNNKISTILEYKIKNNFNKNIIKDIVLHITALKPKYILKKNIPFNILNKEKNNIINKINSKYNNNVKLKIFNNNIKEFYINNCLFEQNFIKNIKYKIKNIIKNNNIEIISFYIIY